MTLTTQSTPVIRSLHYRDLDAIDRLIGSESGFATQDQSCGSSAQQIAMARRWYGPLKCLSLFPNPLQHAFSAYVAEGISGLRGFIQVSPFNQAGTTWRVERIVAGNPQLWPAEELPRASQEALSSDVASALLRHCLETIWRARLWLVEVDISDKLGIGLYRTNGFQPLAQKTYWSLDAALLASLAERSVNLPNLRPVSNADAALLYQLDTVSMPPLVRQAYDRHIADFRTGIARGTVLGIRRLMSAREMVRGYVFEPQRKAAIGHFELKISKDGRRPHSADLTVHPAYTYLYPELLTQMAQLVQGYPEQSLELASEDYQTERETYLTQTGALPERHSTMMFRSVWHKVRESKSVSLENLQLADMLQGLQPSRKPVPGRISLETALPAHEDQNRLSARLESSEEADYEDAPRFDPDSPSGPSGLWSPH